MKAIQIHRFGGPECLVAGELPLPEILPHEVLVRTKGVAVNPVDWKVREGRLRPFAPPNLPMILGWDVSGVVESVGGLVRGLQVGDAIFARPDMTRNGGYAEYIAIRADEVAIAPRNISLLEAASVPLAALTAWSALFDKGEVTRNKSVLIHAASGSVGQFAVQLAKLAGANVIGTASASRVELVRALGADRTVCYDLDDFETVGQGIDVVIDAVGGDVQERSFRVLRPGGVLVTIVGRADKEKAKSYGVSAHEVFVRSNGARLGAIARLIDEGKLKTGVETVMDLSDAAAAHDLVQSRTVKGKIVLRV